MKYQKVSKQKIIESTARVIANKGLDKASVDDIVKEAGVAKGSIYFYFKSKDELLIEGVRYTAKLRISKIREALEDIKSPQEKLRKLIAANNMMMKKDPDAFLLNYAILLSSHKNIKKEVALEHIQKYIQLVTEIINEGIKVKQFRSVDAVSVATTIVLTNDLTGIIGFPNKKIPANEEIFKQLLNLISIKNVKEKTV